MIKAGWRSFMEVCGVWWGGVGYCFNEEAHAITYDNETTDEDRPNCLVYDNRVGTWDEGGGDTYYNHVIFNGAL